jgi:hypothetical protein
MSQTFSRRRLLTTEIAGASGIAGLAAGWRIAARYGLIPPDNAGIWGIGETLTYAAQRVLIAHHSMAREFNRSQVSRVIPVSGPPPETGDFHRLVAGRFADWRLTLDGMVAHPASLSLDQIKRFPMRSQITHQACEEGWSFIAEWHGVPLSYVLNYAGLSTRAKYVVFYALDGTWDSLDLPDALHPQTLLTYALNGRELPTTHGAPLRVRVPRQLGYKSVKYLQRITVTDDIRKIGNGKGSNQPEAGYSWYAGI